MRSLIYLPKWVVVLTSVVVAVISFASGETLSVFFQGQHLADHMLSASSVSTLRGVLDSARNPDLRWSDFTPYKTEVAALYESNRYALVWIENGRVRPKGTR